MSENLRRLLHAHNFRVDRSAQAIERRHEVVVPTLILLGEGDDPDNRKIAGMLEEELLRATKVVVDARHLVNLETPEVFEQLVLCWLSGLDPDSPPGTV